MNILIISLEIKVQLSKAQKKVMGLKKKGGGVHAKVKGMECIAAMRHALVCKVCIAIVEVFENIRDTAEARVT